MPYLTTDGKTIEERILHWRRDHMTDCALRSGKFKWVKNRGQNEASLYNLEKDIGEKNNLIKQYPEVAKRLRQKYVQWEASAPPPAFKSSRNTTRDAQNKKNRKPMNIHLPLKNNRL
jgi:hypothetical protein